MKKQNAINRRGFIKKAAVGAIGAGVMGSEVLKATEDKAPASAPVKIKSYRTLGRTGFKVSDIGIGCSRVFTVPVINALLDAGVNYIDTAEHYGRGASETSIGEAIKGRDRKSLFITTKMLISEKDTKESIIARYQKSLDRMQTGYADALMIHSAYSLEILKNEAFHQAVKQLKSEKKLRFTGVSNHGPQLVTGNSLTMEQILLAAAEDGRFDIMLLIYNFIQKGPGEKILAACKKNNIGTTIMKSNPVGAYYELKGRMERDKKAGRESNPRREHYFKRLEAVANKAHGFIKQHKLQNPQEIREAAFKFVLGNPDAHVLNIAFKSFEEVETLLKLSGTKLATHDKKKLAAFEAGCSSLYCRHACGICETQCPQQVPVNTVMRYNHYFEVGGSEKYAMEKYAKLKGIKAETCSSCSGHCHTACPYGVPIQGLLTMAHKKLTLV
ncbi:MAG: twin-arginine translocation signal domain-containing protein [bacterium]|nr:twin-arginine translocation signal domain-containing protein [bacterium]